MIRDYTSLALKNLKHRGIRSWLTILGVFIGIAAVVALISLGQGLQNAITSQFSTLSADTLLVQNAQTGFGPPGSSSIKPITQHDIDLISSVQGVSVVIPRLLRMVKVEYNQKAIFSYASSLSEDQNKLSLTYINGDLMAEEGRLLRPDDRMKIVLGHDFTNQNLLGKPIKVGSTMNIQGQDFEVVGILKSSGSIGVNRAILIGEKDLKLILNLGDEYDFVAVKVQNKNDIGQVAKDIEEKLRKDRNEKPDEEDFTIQTPVQAISTVNTILTVINIIVIGIAAISLLVGGIGIMNTMYTSVLERTREIGVMKAVGAENSGVLTLFVIESGLLGLAGGISGTIAGLLMAFGVSSAAKSYFGTNILDVQISWPLIIFAISFAFLIGVIAGLLPSLQASKLKPVQALRK